MKKPDNKPQMAPYQVLGVSPKASPAEISAAYKKLAQIFHPDRFAGAPADVMEEAEARMKTLNEAYGLARKGFLVGRPAASSGNGGGGAPGGNGAPPRPGSPGQQAWSGVPWDVAVRDRAAQAVKANEARRAREREARNGNAVPRAKARHTMLSTMTGLGLAMHTNNITCKGCKSLQWLPEGWQGRLGDTAYFCSFCDRLILGR